MKIYCSLHPFLLIPPSDTLDGLATLAQNKPVYRWTNLSVVKRGSLVYSSAMMAAPDLQAVSLVLLPFVFIGRTHKLSSCQRLFSPFLPPIHPSYLPSLPFFWIFPFSCSPSFLSLMYTFTEHPQRVRSCPKCSGEHNNELSSQAPTFMQLIFHIIHTVHFDRLCRAHTYIHPRSGEGHGFENWETQV